MSKKLQMNGNINILNELKEINAAVLLNTDNKNYFFLPEGYFDNFSNDIVTQVFIKSLPTDNPYFVPVNYFENLAETAPENIKVKSFESVINFKAPVYSVPESYFDNLAVNILNKIKTSVANHVQDELEEISPLLSKIPKTNVYSVPENYFEDLQLSSTQKNIKPQAKVISINSKTRKWLSYAAAACIAVVLFGGGYSYFNKKETVTSTTKQYSSTLAAVDVQKQISALSDDEISNYLQSDNNNGVYTNSYDTKENKDMDVQSLLQNISDEEIQHYLNQVPESKKRGGI